MSRSEMRRVTHTGKRPSVFVGNSRFQIFPENPYYMLNISLFSLSGNLIGAGITRDMSMRPGCLYTSELVMKRHLFKIGKKVRGLLDYKNHTMSVFVG